MTSELILLVDDEPAILELTRMYLARDVQELTQAFNAMAVHVIATQTSQRDFIANVSHELKTPLTSVQGFAQALMDGTADTPEARRQAAKLIQS